MAVDVARELAVLLSVAFAGYLLAAWTRQGLAIAEVLVGLAVGPSLLGVVHATEFVQALAFIGALVLLFLVGLENEFTKVFRGRYALIALAGVVLPWIGGWALARAFGYDSPSALFVGTALTATSIAITASALREMGELDGEAGRAILGAAVIDDVLGLLALAITVQAARQGSVDAPAVALLAGKALLFLAVGGLGGARVLQPALERLDGTRLTARHPEALFVLAIAIAFLYALAAELVGLSGIVGAFLAGVVLNPTPKLLAESFHQGASYLTAVFSSIFFVSLGVLVDLHQVALAVVPFVLALTGVAVLTKLAGCGLAARALGMARRDSALVGVGMAPRGEVALIVGVIALQAGAVGQEGYTAVVLMSLLTTLATPPMLRAFVRAAPAPAASPGPDGP